MGRLNRAAARQTPGLLSRCSGIVAPLLTRAIDSLTSLMKSGRLFVCMSNIRVHKQALILFMVIMSQSAYAVAPGTIISNTASASYGIAGVPGYSSNSNTDAVTTTIVFTPSTVEFYQYNPVAPTLTTAMVINSSYADGSAAGPMIPMANPSWINPGTGPTIINVANPVPLSPATSYHQGEPIFVVLTDSNRNVDSAARDLLRITLTVSATGDTEVIEFIETGVNTGVFIGYIQSAAGAATQYNGILSVAENTTITAAYTDSYDITDTANAQALVDPFGIVFDSATGTAINGATVRIVDAFTGMDAVVYGDDGVSSYPATVITGTGASDSGGTSYTFPAGGYRFPLMLPGTYRFEVTPPAGYSVPSSVPEVTLQTLPGAPFAIDSNASYLNDFVLNAGPPLNVDIPADASGTGLFLTMKASKDKVTIGEFVRYTLTLVNNNTIAVSAATIINNSLPRGLRYYADSAHLDQIGISDPVISNDGRQLVFAIGDVAPGASVILTYVAVVDAEADGTVLSNTAQASNAAAVVSNIAADDVVLEKELLNSRSHVLGRVMSGNCAAEPVKNGFVDMRLQSELVADDLQYTLSLNGTTVPLGAVNLDLGTSRELEILPDTIVVEGHEDVKPQKTGNGLRIGLGDLDKNWSRVVRFRARLGKAKPGTYNLVAVLGFSTATAENVKITAINSVLREQSTGERKSMVTLSDFEKSRIEPGQADKIEINALVRELRGRAIKRIRVMGHTDAVALNGKTKYRFDDNYELSLARAKAVASHLRKKLKFSRSAIQVQGFGPDMPIADNNIEAGRRSNRRVEVEVITTHGKTEYQNTLLRSDSGIKRITTEGRKPEKTDAVLGGELKGIAGVRIVTEEGIYAVTDKDGLYHIEGLRPGTHVLQVDESSLPDDLEVMLCEENTRFAGSGNSRFIDLQGGSLWRADFYLKKKDPIKARLDLQMRSELDGPLAHFSLDASGRKFDYRNTTVLVMMPPELEYVEGSLFIGNDRQDDPEIRDGVFTIRLGNYINEDWSRTIRFSAYAAGTRENAEIVTRATAMFNTAEGKRHRTPYAENSLLHNPAEARQKQFIFRPRFSSARARLKQTDKIRLDRILGQFRSEDVVHIRVVGHADNVKLRGQAKARWGGNTELSRARAAAVADYIKQKLRLNDGQMTVDAMGDQQPIASNKTNEGRAINRRVELFVRTRQEDEAGIWKPVQKDNCPVYVTAQYELDEDNRHKLDQLVKSIRGQRVRRIRVVGHSDSKQLTASTRKQFKDNYELSRRRAERVAVELAEKLDLEPEQFVIEVLGPAQPVADNSSRDGRARNRRVEVFVEHIDMKAVTDQQLDWKLVRADSGIQSVKLQRELVADSGSQTEAPKVLKNNIAEINAAWLQKASPDFAWAAPQDGYIPESDTISLAIKHDGKGKLVLHHDGKPVNMLHLDGVRKSSNGKAVVTVWRGIRLKPGSNIFEAELTAADGQKQKLSRDIYYAGVPAKAEFVQAYSQLEANGREPIIIAMRLLDREGKPVRPGITGGFSVEQPYMPEQLDDALKHNPVSGSERPSYRVTGDGIAQLRVKPTTRSGKLVIHLMHGNGIEQDVTVWIKPAQRDWVLVGLAEGSAGYRTLEGNMTALQDRDIEEGYYDDGRLAFYAKGSIKGEWLLTAAYDSKKDKDTPAAVLHGLIEPDKYYTLYGDGSERRHDAASTEKLYVKLERQQFYALFGDFNTGMTVTELSRYSRSMTGLKSEYAGKHLSYNVFVSETDNGFVKDEIRGDGTSGLYRLSRQNIVANSDKVVIETRDRFNSHVVISSQRMSRFIDYNIDPVAGTIFFKQPVFSQDGSFNPIYIVVDYEVESGAEPSVIAGGRAAVKTADGSIEIGASAIHEGIEGAKASLAGIDTTIKIGENGRIRAEAASTDNENGTTESEGSAWLAEYEYAGKKLSARVYAREQEQDFGLGQQKGSESATRKYGVLGAWQLDSELSLQGEYRHEDVLATEATRDVTEARLNYATDAYTLFGGLRSAVDEDGSGIEHESSQLTLGGSYFFLNKRASVRANMEMGLGSDAEANPDYPSRYILGMDYKVTQATKLFLEQEWTRGALQDTEATRIGFETSPWQGATMRSDLGNEYSEAGARTYSSVGLKQGIRLSEHLSLDLGLDRRKTLREPGNTPFNVNVPPASGTVNNDYTATSLGLTYRQDKWSATGRVEGRNADNEDKNTVLFGFYRENAQGVGFAAKYNWFGRLQADGLEESQAEAELSLVYRPADSHWNVLDKLTVVDNERIDVSGETVGRKYINNMNVNYLVSRSGQLAMHWGLKEVIDSFEEGDFRGRTQTVGLEYRHDINSWWDMGLQGSVLDVDAANNQRYSYGVSTGFNVVRGVWLSIGYNKEGFEDRDFSTAGYSMAGPYIKFRMSFDHYTSRRVMAWWEKDDRPAELNEVRK